jgi:hypothetical protein
MSRGPWGRIALGGLGGLALGSLLGGGGLFGGRRLFGGWGDDDDRGWGDGDGGGWGDGGDGGGDGD